MVGSLLAKLVALAADGNDISAVKQAVEDRGPLDHLGDDLRDGEGKEGG